MDRLRLILDQDFGGTFHGLTRGILALTPSSSPDIPTCVSPKEKIKKYIYIRPRVTP